MTDLQAAMARLEPFVASRGLRLTAQRRAIVEVFFRGGKHPSLLELLDAASEVKPGVGYATVYRTMRLLVEAGLAAEHKFGENQTRYEPCWEDAHHDHLICVRCGRIVEFEDEAIEAFQTDLARRHGIKILRHKHEIYGECVPTCIALDSQR